MNNINDAVRSIFPNAQNITPDKDARTICFDLVGLEPHALQITEALHSYMKLSFRTTALSLKIAQSDDYISTKNMHGTFITAVIDNVVFHEIDIAPMDECNGQTGFGLADLARFKQSHPQ